MLQPTQLCAVQGETASRRDLVDSHRVETLAGWPPRTEDVSNFEYEVVRQAGLQEEPALVSDLSRKQAKQCVDDDGAKQAESE